MANNNCLAGLKCPECGSEEPFWINVTAQALMYDQGSDEVQSIEWEDDSIASCPCGYRGTIDSLKEEESCA